MYSPVSHLYPYFLSDMQPTPEHTPASNQSNASDEQQVNRSNNAPTQAPEPTVGHGHKSPQYGDFGHASTSTTNASVEGDSVTEGGAVAPPIAFPEQRGSVPQNLDTPEVRHVANAEYEEQREGWAKDDPRYGGGTRNWATNEPANHSTGPAPDTDDQGHNPNVGNNDNPDEFSALRPDEGRDIPGSGK
ncbi:hypothetical protein GCM10027346_08920 [Hymenobacter seoulensis]